MTELTVNKNDVSPAGGVVNTGNVSNLYDHIYFGTDYIDVNFENYMSEKPDNIEECDWSDYFEDDDHYYLIGFKRCYDGHIDNVEYIVDETAEFSAIVTPGITQIVHSKYMSHAHHCSPCYPLQNNLDDGGLNDTYALPEHLYDNEYDTHLTIYEIVE